MARSKKTAAPPQRGAPKKGSCYNALSMFVAVGGAIAAVGVFKGGVYVQDIVTIALGRVGTSVSIYEDVLQKNEDQHKDDATVASNFYNLVTDFYEYAWGESFHFGFRRKGEPFSVAAANAENHVATQLHVTNGDRVLDMGCGIGGPLRSIVRKTGANVTGLTINKYQVERAYAITKKLPTWIQERSHYVVQDYLNVQGMELGAYDAAFYMESSLHCEDRTQTFKETYKLLRPGGRVVAMEYTLLPGWNASDAEQQRLMSMHLHGNGAAATPTIEENVAMFKAAGFEVLEHYDFANMGAEIYGDEHFPWWGDLLFATEFSLLPAHPWVRRALAKTLNFLAWLGMVPKDVPLVAELMNEGGDGLAGLGKLQAITPQYYILCQKPLHAEK